jgi:hypothetical protein
MQGFLNRASLTVEAIAVRPAQLSDRAALHHLTENNHRVHFNLDWWSFDQWLPADRPSEAIWLAFDQEELIGLLAAPFEQVPLVWLRSIAIANGYPAAPVFSALLTHARSALLAQGATQMAVMAHPEWVDDLTQRLSFTLTSEIVTLRKSDRAMPELMRSPCATIRRARPEDIPVIAENDRAFDVLGIRRPRWHILQTFAFRRRRERRSGGGARLQRCLRRARTLDPPGGSSRLSTTRHRRAVAARSLLTIEFTPDLNTQIDNAARSFVSPLAAIKLQTGGVMQQR